MFNWSNATNASASLEVSLLEEGKMYGNVFELVKDGKLEFDEFQEHVSNQQDFSNKRHMFWTQAILSGGIVIFSGTMLAIHGVDAAYMSLISGILGYWLPTPLSQKSGFVKPKVVSNEGQKQKKDIAQLNKQIDELKHEKQKYIDIISKTHVVNKAPENEHLAATGV